MLALMKAYSRDVITSKFMPCISNSSVHAPLNILSIQCVANLTLDIFTFFGTLNALLYLYLSNSGFRKSCESALSTHIPSQTTIISTAFLPLSPCIFLTSLSVCLFI